MTHITIIRPLKYKYYISFAKGTNAQQAAWQYGGVTNTNSTFSFLFNIILTHIIKPIIGLNNKLKIINLAAVAG